MVKNLPANAGNIRDVGSDPELGRSSGTGNGNLCQHSCLENFMNRRAWWATVHGVAETGMTKQAFISFPIHHFLPEIASLFVFIF